MIRFRVGQSWKREDAGPQGPRDAFTFELDGVNLLPGANDEPLFRLVGALVDTVADLAAGERAGQVSLDDVHLELCFWRCRGLEVEASVVDLGRPPRRLRAPVRLELPELVDAATRCARGFLRDERVRQLVARPELAAVEGRLSALDATVLKELPARETAPWTFTRGPGEGLGFAFADDEGRTASFSRRSRAGLVPLLFGGRLALGTGELVEGLPFLMLLGLARAAGDGPVPVAGRQVPAQAIFEAGLDACVALRERNPALAANPYVETLQVRCTEGLALLRPVAPAPAAPAPVAAPPKDTGGTPLAVQGALRKVRLSPKWTRQVALGEEGGRLLLGRGLVVVTSAHAAHGFTTRGATRFRRLSARGVATASSGDVIAATPERVVSFDARRSGARWIRNHDGATIGPSLLELAGVWVTPLGARGALCVDPLTGRELWRLDPPRTQRSHLSVLGSRVLVATDGGSLFGVDATDGQVRFRVKASLPCTGPAVGVGTRALAVLNRGEHTAVYLCDALAGGTGSTPAGAIAWTRELLLAWPSQPVTARGRTFVGGLRDAKTMVVCIGPRGQVLWERALPCEARTLSLAPFEGGVIAADARGVCVRLLPDGQPDWVLGAAGDELNHRIPVSVHRRLAVVPGPVLRIVEPTTGRVLTELEAGARLADVAADRRLNLYLYKEPGELEAWAPGSLLSVV